MDSTPASHQAYRVPAEWEPHDGTWLQWPQDKVYRGYELKLEGTWLAMVDALHQHENVHIIVADERQRDHVADQLQCFAIGLENVCFYVISTNDVWARDNGPILVVSSDSDVAITDWEFNGWGKRFPFDLDNLVPAAIGDHLSMPVFRPAGQGHHCRAVPRSGGDWHRCRRSHRAWWGHRLRDTAAAFGQKAQLANGGSLC